MSEMSKKFSDPLRLGRQQAESLKAKKGAASALESIRKKHAKVQLPAKLKVDPVFAFEDGKPETIGTGTKRYVYRFKRLPVLIVMADALLEADAIFVRSTGYHASGRYFSTHLDTSSQQREEVSDLRNQVSKAWRY